MATIPEVRGDGYGRMLVHELEKYAVNNEMKTVLLHARQYAIGFYQKMGYTICSEPFEEVGIKHVVMQKELH
jgi:predicted GNAT family N-acyltransferase